jgi:hypothetical protein
MNATAYLPDIGNDEGEIIAFFGQAVLVRTLDLKFELRGGSHNDRLTAQEWISLFLHEAVVKEV